MATRFGLDHEGRRVEIEPEGTWTGDILRLFVDGEQVAETKRYASDITVAADGIEVTARMAWYGGAIQSAELKAGGEPVPLEPEPGSRAARQLQFKRDRPGLYAARHVAKGIARVLAPLVVVGLGIKLLPPIAIDLPIDLPRIPFPDIPFPDIPFPSIHIAEPPGWVLAIVESAKYWAPILIGLVLAVREWRRRRATPPRA